MNRIALLESDALDATLAWRGTRAVTGRAFVADVLALAERLPARGHVLNVCVDRYRFAVGLGAAIVRGQISLLPPNHTPDMVERLRAAFPDAYALIDAPTQIALPTEHYPHTLDGSAHDKPDGLAVPTIDAEQVAAYVFTSGSTGVPRAHPKTWGSLVHNASAAAERLGLTNGNGARWAVVGTVPPQHMYGFESTVLIAWRGAAALTASRPFYPADIVDALAALPRPRMLVTTPFHLRTLLDAQLDLPPVDGLLCATAPLALELAREAEQRFNAPLTEIYGCTEAGQLATRRTTRTDGWTTLRGIRVGARDDGMFEASGGHVGTPVALGDLLECETPERFRLVGRSQDMINIAGKRTSLAHLNHQLNTIAGVRDGVFFMPDDDGSGIVRPVAFVVAPDLTAQRIASELRRRVDDVFIPRRIVMLDALPRGATGKLPREALAALLATPQPTAAPQPAVHHERLTVPVDHPALAGHFPGRPIVPGVVLLDAVVRVAERAHGRAIERWTLASAKFLRPVGPGATLDISLRESGAQWRFEIHVDGGVAANGAFAVATPTPTREHEA
ncbi:MAG TPA: AMP-binding protein [Burkholderiaceae bacterium]|nr:AMP-binding protein [Burkholderiaceae bacterium]